MLPSRRRAALSGLGLALASPALATAALSTAALSTAALAQPSAGFRFVFMPCIHYRPEWGAPEGLAAALAAIEALSPRPDFILTGGDAVHDLRALSYPAAQARLDAFLALWNASTSIPTRHMIGNHEIVGFSNAEARESDALFGKVLPLRAFGLTEGHYGFNHQGWRFLVLDNVQTPRKGLHVAHVPDVQLDFLRAEIAAGPAMPGMVFSHVPLLSATEFFGGWARMQEGRWSLTTNRMVDNPRAVLDAVAGGDIKAFVSCHIHELERLSVANHHFICAGSVSGQMWNGPRTRGPLGTQEGFGVFDCRPDGGFDFAYQGFGWRTRNPNPPPANRGGD